jgi:ribosomal protein S18 acetylase RimI-like enzyme
MEIREATINEWENVRNLYLTLLKENPQAFVDKLKEVSSKDKNYWLGKIGNSDGKIFIATDNGKSVGMGRINFYEEHSNVPVMHKLGVLNNYQNQGIAKKLVEAREEWAKSMGAKKIRLYVIENNQKAVKFAEKNGYKTIEKSENDIEGHNGEMLNVLLLEKDLN